MDLDSYLAGVFDGEGYITVQHRDYYACGKTPGKLHTRLLVGVGMTSRRIVTMFHERFGGSFREENLKNGRSIFVWYVSSSTAIPALTMFSQLCISKREQAVLALEVAGLLKAGRATGKRLPGWRVVTDQERSHRLELAAQITALKQTDA